MFDFLHRWRSVSLQTHFSAPPAFSPSLGANLTIGEINFGPRTAQTAARRPQTQCPRENRGRKRAQAKRSFVALCARNIAPRPLPHPSPRTRRARGRPQGGCGNEQESRGGWAKSPCPVQPRPALRNVLAPPAPSRTGSRRAQARIEKTAKRSETTQRQGAREPPQRFARDRAARAQANLAVCRARAPSKTSHRPMTKFGATNRRTLETPAGPPAARGDSLPRKGQGAPTQTSAVLTVSPAPDPRRKADRGKKQSADGLPFGAQCPWRLTKPALRLHPRMRWAWGTRAEPKPARGAHPSLAEEGA